MLLESLIVIVFILGFINVGGYFFAAIIGSEFSEVVGGLFFLLNVLCSIMVASLLFLIAAIAVVRVIGAG